MGLLPRKLSQAAGNSKSRMVWPVGAVSKMTVSKPPEKPSPVMNRENSSKEAISVVHAPDSPSLVFSISSFDAIALSGSIALLRYSAAAVSGLIFIVNRVFKFW